MSTTEAEAVPSGVLLLESVNRLRAAETLLQTRARAQAGLKANEFHALQYIATAAATGSPARPRHVAETLGVTEAAVSQLLDRLVARGLVHRERDTEDRRGRVLYLTDDARAALRDAYGELPGAVQDLLDAVPEEDARRVASLAAAVQDIVDRTAMTR
ncbi:MarR family winged helix-turn-helix transcriptional regulator [Curtobacterium sp. SP.BCp]|uniref:MarR family winged helix-turn-helix transcriptional regulator n=1 Tax=Curtobacterium sp. SP.BCp TaxID=3435230 RepID=UPI003F738497